MSSLKTEIISTGKEQLFGSSGPIAGSKSLPYLFVDSTQRYTTHEWYRLLAEGPTPYNACKIVSLTWAKLGYSLLIFKADYEPEGMAFKDQNVSGMSYQRPMGSPEVITQKDYLEPIIHDLQTKETMQDYETAL